MRGICPACERETELKLINKREVVEVYGEPIEVEVTLNKCEECGEEFEDPKAKTDSIDSAFRAYRHRHSMLTPEEIKQFRSKYDLTQGELSKLLGWGGATLSRYENGALQDDTHEKALRLAMDPRNLLMLVQQTPDAISVEKKERLTQQLIIEEEEEYSFGRLYAERFGRYDADILSGYRKLSLEKLFNAVLFFCKEGNFKTVLNKLLFYADFTHFRDYAVSITGARYAHVPFGPAPDKYAHYYATLMDEGALRLEEISFDDDVVGEKYVAMQSPDLSMFSESEIRVLMFIKDYFRGYTANRISRYSHNEDGYKETTDGEIISYDYANLIGIGKSEKEV